LVFLTAG